MRSVHALLCLCLMPLIASCGSTPPRFLPEPEVVRLTPPEPLLQDCPQPQWGGETLGDLIDYIKALQAALVACNVDKQHLRDWAAGAADPLR